MIKAETLSFDLGIDFFQLSSFCKGIGFVLLNPYQELTKTQYISIFNSYCHYNNLKRNNRFNTNINPISKDSKIDFQKTLINPYSKNILEIINNPSIFNDRQPKKIQHYYRTYESVFSDFEAFSICYGLENSYARKLARDYFKRPNEEHDIIEAHRIAMNTLERYGAELISFVMGLPPLPFKAFETNQIFALLDKQVGNSTKPILRVAFQDNNKNNEKLVLTFLQNDSEIKSIYDQNSVTVKNKTTGKTIMIISRDGTVIPQSQEKNIIPILQLFARFSYDYKTIIFNYGLQTGECSICGRTLTDPDSIKIGIGPTCRKYF